MSYGLRAIREHHIEQHFIKEVKKRGGEVRKMKWIGRAHAPDRLAMMIGCNFLAELKAPGKDARAGQAREHKRLRAAGFKVYVLDTYEKIYKLFRHYDHDGVFPDAL